MTSIRDCQRRAQGLVSISDSARLDVELLLADVLQVSRTYLFTWPEKLLTAAQLADFEQAFNRRLQGEPIAHILGHRDFWSLDLAVDPSTLIPRPDTERLVEVVLSLALAEPVRVLDLGTGTGAIALALGKEQPDWQVEGVDKSAAAVALAQKNAERNGIDNCRFYISDWFEAVAGTGYSLIVSNPPYIDPTDPHLQQGDVRFEPLSALVAADSGLADIRQILAGAGSRLLVGGWLVIEHGYDQGDVVRQLFIGAGLSAVETFTDYGGNERVTVGQKV